MKIGTTLLFIICFSLNLFAVKPLTEKPFLPSKYFIEFYEDSPELFAMIVMEYYQKAIILKTQLEMLGQKATQEISAPTVEEIGRASCRERV